MKIKYDPAADAVYVRLAEPKTQSPQAEVTEQGVIVDVDRSGQPRGFEFLCVRSKGLPTDELPPPVAFAIEAFIASGALDADEVIERHCP
jgi:uncharacterized protein YuzE